MAANKENSMIPEMNPTPMKTRKLTQKRTTNPKRQLFKVDDNDGENVTNWLDRKIKEHNEIERKTFKVKYNYDTLNDKPTSASDNFTWISVMTAPQFYHESLARSKSQRKHGLEHGNAMEMATSTDTNKVPETEVLNQPIGLPPKFGLSEQQVSQAGTQPVDSIAELTL